MRHVYRRNPHLHDSKIISASLEPGPKASDNSQKGIRVSLITHSVLRGLGVFQLTGFLRAQRALNIPIDHMGSNITQIRSGKEEESMKEIPLAIQHR